MVLVKEREYFSYMGMMFFFMVVIGSFEFRSIMSVYRLCLGYFVFLSFVKDLGENFVISKI